MQIYPTVSTHVASYMMTVGIEITNLVSVPPKKFWRVILKFLLSRFCVGQFLCGVIFVLLIRVYVLALVASSFESP